MILKEVFSLSKLVKLYGDWCAPCKKFAPVFEEARTKINVPVEMWDVDTLDKDWLQSQGVTSIPAVMFIKTTKLLQS